jgi:tetratricopeptide (TPR) repeat protein/transcriptional regulator with XRE-family HTH domain
MKKPARSAPNPHLKRAREQQGWSQEYVAREVGTDAFTVSRWERGITTPSPHFRQQLCTLFGLSVAELGLLPLEAQETSAEKPPREPAAQRTHSALPIFDPAIPPAFAQYQGLIGRDDLLHSLKQKLLSRGPVALSAINGLPGVGKTALATALAYDDEVRAHFPDGVLWAGLGYQPDVLGLLIRWGTALGCSPPDMAQRSRPQAWAASIHDAIGQRRLLLIIDDAWEIAEALALQVGGPNCAHLVTTRFPEIARRFASEATIAVRELESEDGRLLLLRLAPEVVQAEPEEARALVAAVGGLPLALTLLGNFLRTQAHSGQPRRLRAALERLRHAEARLQLSEAQPLVGGHPGLSAGAPLSLQTVIGMSDQQVSAPARAALRALAVFPPKPNTFSEEAALAVSALPVETLDELTDAGLLESSGPTHYTLHQTIADYARMQLADAAALERLVDYYVLYVETHSESDAASVDQESNNILAALEAAFECAMRPALVRGVHAFAPLLIRRGIYTVAEAQLQRSLEAAQALEEAASQATAWLQLGKIAEARGNYVQAYEYWQDGLALARQSSHDGLVAETLMELGVLARQQGQPAQAHQYFEEALEAARRAGDRRREGDTLRNLGILLREQGQPERARQLYEEALAVFQEVGEQQGSARTLNNLGVLARQQGQPERARQLLEEALEIFRQLEDRRGAAIALGNLSRLAENRGQLREARQLYEEALADFEQLGDRRSTAQVVHNLGTLAWAQGQPEQARHFFEDSLATVRQLGDQRTAALTLNELGALAREQGQLEEAGQFLAEAHISFQQLSDRREGAFTLRELGILARVQGEPEQARQLLDEALHTFQLLDDQREGAFTLRELGILAREQSEPDQARQLLDEALHTFQHLKNQREIARTQKELGILFREQGEIEQARQLLEQAIATLRETGDRRGVARTLQQLGLQARQQGQPKEALRLLLKAGAGLALVDAPDARAVETLLGQLRSQLGEGTFRSLAARVSKEAPEPVYELTQAAWAAAIGKLAASIEAR